MDDRVKRVEGRREFAIFFSRLSEYYLDEGTTFNCICLFRMFAH